MRILRSRGRGLGTVGMAIAIWLLAAAAGAAGTEEEGGLPRAFAAPNVRLGLQYDFLRVDETKTYAASTGATIQVPRHEAHSGRAAIVGSLPIWGPLGARVSARGSYGHRQRSLDGLGPGNNDVSSYGAGLELVLRDPRIGAITGGGSYDRLSRSGPTDANAYGGNAGFAIYFPDLGLGPIDWNVRFDFVHRDVSGTAGQVDIDADHYRVAGSAGWYASDDVQILLGGRWDRAEEEFSSEDNREGFFQVRWRLPVPVVPTELTFGASAGVSVYKEQLFRDDHRAIYGANAGLVFRWGSGETLLDSIRRYD